MTRLIFLLLFIVLQWQYPVMAQSWFAHIDEISQDANAYSIVQTPDGGYVLAGSDYPEANLSIAKLDANGKKQWSTILSHASEVNALYEFNPSIILKPDGTYVIGASAATDGSSPNNHLILWHLDQTGSLIDSTHSATMDLTRLKVTSKGEYLAAATTYECAVYCDYLRSLFLLDTSFHVKKDYTNGSYHLDINLVLDAVELPDGRFMMLGIATYFEGNDWISFVYLEYFTPTGGYSRWQIDYDEGGTFPLNGKIALIDDEHVYVGYYLDNYYRVKKLNVVNRKNVWERTVDKKWRIEGNMATTLDDGVVIAALPNDTTIALVKYDFFGNKDWENSIHLDIQPNPSSPYNYAIDLVDIIQVADGGFAILGSHVNDWTSPLMEMFVIKTNAFGKVGGSVDGFVKVDASADCNADNTEAGLEGWIVEVKGDSTSYYATTDATGYYYMWIPPGEYAMHFSHTSMSGATACQENDTITVVNQIDTIHFDAAIMGIEDCSLLSVDVSIPFVRNCTTNVYKVQYCNFGVSDLAVMMIDVKTNAYMDFVSASAPYQEEDTIYHFAIHDVQSGECGTITFSVFLNCQTPANYHHCLEVMIHVDSLCMPPATTSHNPYHDKDCQVSGQPFDPNDKIAQPVGEGPERMIPADTLLTYTIHFQNLGTDTAFNVVIRDTLSHQFDMSSFQAGGASHPYRWEIKDQGVLEIFFDNIQLPDSTINEVGSHGYVTYSLLPKKDIVPGQRIENNASIYFDYVAPVVTGLVFHTIDKERWWIEHHIALCSGDLLGTEPLYADTTLVDTIQTEYSDTIITTHVTLWPVYDILYADTFCVGDTNPLSDLIFDTAGSYTDEYQHVNQWGCNSILHYSFIVYPSPDDTTWIDLPVGSIFKEILITQDTVLTWHDTTANGCPLQQTDIISVVVTGTNEDPDLTPFVIYPNPFTNQLLIQGEKSDEQLPAFSIMDALGRTLLGNESFIRESGNVFRCDVSRFAGGVYILEIKVDSRKQTYLVFKME